MQIRKGKDLLCSLGETSSKRSVIKKSDVPWEPPPFGWLKVNVDDAYTKKTGKAGAGIIIRNHFGEVLLSAWKVLHDARSAEEVEAYACLEGVSLAVEWGREKTILESDCLPIINSLISPDGTGRAGHPIPTSPFLWETYPATAGEACSCGEANPLAGRTGPEHREGARETETHRRRQEIDPASMSPPLHTILLDCRRCGSKKR
jgi:hypothetical protein